MSSDCAKPYFVFPSSGVYYCEMEVLLPYATSLVTLSLFDSTMHDVATVHIAKPNKQLYESVNYYGGGAREVGDQVWLTYRDNETDKLMAHEYARLKYQFMQWNTPHRKFMAQIT